MSRRKDPKPEHYAAGAPIRRGRAWAQLVFWLTGTSSVLYNTYNALSNDHMHWYLAVPAGAGPLIVAIGVLEFSGSWREDKLLQWAAWLITAGAMGWSAVAINSVIPHGWGFGLICDAAALAAMRYLLNGPTAASAVAAVTAKITAALADAAGERSVREETEARAARAAAQTRQAHTAELDALRAAHQSELDNLSAQLETTATARADAEERAARAEAKAARTASRTPARRTPQAPARDTVQEPAPSPFQARRKAEEILAERPDISGAALAAECGMKERWGQLRKEEWAARRTAGDEKTGS